MKLRYICQDTDRHGNVRIYVRKPGCPKVRINAPVGSDEFFIEYTAAIRQAAAEKPLEASLVQDSLHWLFVQYMAKSGDYKLLSDVTKHQMKCRLDKLCQSKDELGRRRGDKDFRSFQPQHVLFLRDEKIKTPTEANKLVTDLRRVWEWAKAAGLATSNPALEVKTIPITTDGFHTWTRDELDAYRVRHPIGTKARLAFDLLLYTGGRRSDVVGFGPQMVKDGWIRWTEVKGRKKLVKKRELPILPVLQATLDASPSGQLVFLITSYNKPFTLFGFSFWFKERCREAGLHHCSAHGLRKAGATIAAEQGATEAQLMAIYGWESPRVAAIYTRKVNRTALAASAMHFLDAAAPTENAVSHSKTVGQK